MTKQLKAGDKGELELARRNRAWEDLEETDV